jgi:hypothetical protein
MKNKNQNRRRKEPTAEQKAAAEERRAQIKNLCALIKAMPPEKRVLLASSYGIRNTEGRELSIYNQCLLVHQLDTVSIVGGFAQWKKLDRHVKKGSRALAIWVPCSRKAESGGPDCTAIVPAGVNPDELDERFFVLANVFDISQTESTEERAAREARETPALPAPSLALPEHAEAYEVETEELPTHQASLTLA